MIEITFPDGSKKEFESGITTYEIAEGISKSLLKKAIIAEFNGEEYDLRRALTESGDLKIIVSSDEQALEVIRHDAAHLLAQAVKELYEGIQVTIGPSIDNGFYYDFSKGEPFTPDDLIKIEKRMQQLSQANIKIEREEWNRDEAVKFFKSQGEDYKAEIIASIPVGQDVTLYRQGNFIDLCRGPHAPSTSYVKHFKLMKIAGAYWRGDSNNEMLQRIYGTAWASKQDLDSYLHRLEEAEKRDHRKLGKNLELFHIQEEAVGSVFWHENGAILYKNVQDLLSKKLLEHGYFDVRTPLLIDRVLWEKSGHWEKFRENMFIAESDDRSLALKPMNCPGHVQIFNQKVRSYRDLPLRMSEFGCCHRNEPSGSLHGLMRVRSFVQDDAHIFCTEEQITEETKSFTKLLLEIYEKFGFTEVSLKFSDRPDKRAGSDSVWDKAEQSLLNAMQEIGMEYTLNPGEGAFYGPKIEFVLKDAIGREWQCGTLQVDFVLPERLDAKYTDRDGSIKRPVMIHRAVLGTFERFLGILIENCAGTFPYWLAPKQVAVLNVTNSVDGYAKEVHEYLIKNNVRSVLDISSDKIGNKIRKNIAKRIPYQLVIGNKEAEDRTVNLRQLGNDEHKVYSLSDILVHLV